MSVDAFSDEYEPKTIVGREKEQRAIYYYLKDVSRGGSSKILYIRGIPGIGKTTVTRAVTRQFEENSDNSVVVYIRGSPRCCEICLRDYLLELFFF